MFFNRAGAIACCAIIFSVNVFSQSKEPKIKFGDIKPDDFKPQSYSIDSSADAVYLFNEGSARYDLTGNAFTINFKLNERIRLLHKKSFDHLATIQIPLFAFGSKQDKLEDLQAATYVYEDGRITKTTVDKNSIFKEKDGNTVIVKFTFPDLKEGCIIEFAYTKSIANFTDLPRWNFQSEYPELWNEYTVEFPNFLDFVVLNKGYLSPVIDTVIRSYSTYMQGNTIERTWAFKNIPALTPEPFITSLSNHRESVEFQVSSVEVPGQDKEYFMHDWFQTANDLMKEENFGADLNRENGWLKNDVKAAILGETDSLAKAKKIFQYVRDNYTCTDSSEIFLSQPIKKTAEQKKGSVADINLLLTAMLKFAGFNANPVLLSKRDHGKAVDIYPILNKFNYLIVQVYVQDTSYLMDAANSLLGFNHLSTDCYNGDARVIAPEPIVINLSADSLQETELTNLFLINDEDGKVSGTYKCIMSAAESNNLRAEIRKTSTDEYFKNIRKSFLYDLELNNTTIDSLKQIDMPVSVQYDISFKPQDEILYFNPLMALNMYKENPFKAAQRLYPVEMPYCMDKTYILTMQVPTGYKVDELPKSIRLSLNENEGMFEYLIEQNNDRIQMRCRLKLNKANFESDDYDVLRKFFASIVEKESEQIVFKKIN